jgi:hypothetical protein
MPQSQQAAPRRRRWNPTEDQNKQSTEPVQTGDPPEETKTQTRPKRLINFDDTRFEVSSETVDEIFETIKDRQEKTGEGSPARELAVSFCGDEKFASVISFVVGKYLAEDIEAVQGVGYCVKGMPRKEATVEVSPQILHAVEKLLMDSLQNAPQGGRGISEDRLVLLAAAKGIVRPGDDGLPNDAEVRAAIRMLLNQSDKYEQHRGSGIRRRAAAAPQEG